MAKKPIQIETEDDPSKFAPAGLKWLYEMEAVHSPTLLNNLYGNLYAFPGVSDVEILIDRYQRKMLIYVKFTFFIRKFLKGRRKELIIGMLDQLQELLPSFEFRIVEDRAIFDLALKRMESMLFGGKSAQKPIEPPKPTSTATPQPGPATGASTPSDSVSATSEPSNGSQKAIETDPKKPSGT